MLNFLLSYQSTLDTILIFSFVALSQFIALRAGLFALSTAGFVAIGAYTAAIFATVLHLHPVVCVVSAVAAATVVGGLLSIPLARLRGHFQAIATLAFVEIVRNMALYFEGLTGGARGINGIPKVVSSEYLLPTLVGLVVLLMIIGKTGIGRAFDAVRQDDTVARSLGISVSYYHTLGFCLSAAIGGLGGALLAFGTYSITPEEFGFPLIVSSIGAVVLGGRNAVAGPIVGTAVLILLPEVARPLADNRILLYGAVLILAITYLPRGLVDSFHFRRRPKDAVVAQEAAS